MPTRGPAHRSGRRCASNIACSAGPLALDIVNVHRPHSHGNASPDAVTWRHAGPQPPSGPQSTAVYILTSYYVVSAHWSAWQGPASLDPL